MINPVSNSFVFRAANLTVLKRVCRLGMLVVGLGGAMIPLAHAQPSTLRVACDDDAAGAEISINGQFKGECPIDLQVKAGTHKLTATKVVAGKKKTQEQTVRLGEAVVKRVEVSFGAPRGGTAAAAPQVDPAAVARLRYEAELTEYNRNIEECRPKFNDELRRLKQELREATAEHREACIAFWGSYESSCGVFDAESRELWERKYAAEEKLKSIGWSDDPAGSWCRDQFTAPREPD